MRITNYQFFCRLLPCAMLFSAAGTLSACELEPARGEGSPRAEGAANANDGAVEQGGSTDSAAGDVARATGSNARPVMPAGDDAGSAAGDAAPASSAAGGAASTPMTAPGSSGAPPAVVPPAVVPPAVVPPAVVPPAVVPPTVTFPDGGIDSGISAECDNQLAKCNGIGPDLIRDCVAVARRCLPVDKSPECNAQLDKCEKGPNPLVDCPAVALVCP